MKRIIGALICILLIIPLCGCDTTEQIEDNSSQQGRFAILFNDGSVTVVVDRETGVQYLSNYKAGTVVMVDENGKPLIYNAED